MRTEQVAYNPYFTAGNVRYVKTHKLDGTIDDIQKELEPLLGNLSDELKKMIAAKPYDLFIEKSRNMKGFYEINANVNYENVIGTDITKKGRPSVIYRERPERIISAADEAMESFEKTPDYKKLVKRENIFKYLWNRLRGKI